MKISKKKNITPKQESTLNAILESYTDTNDIVDEIRACDVFSNAMIGILKRKKIIKIAKDDMLIVISG